MTCRIEARAGSHVDAAGNAWQERAHASSVQQAPIPTQQVRRSLAQSLTFLDVAWFAWALAPHRSFRSARSSVIDSSDESEQERQTRVRVANALQGHTQVQQVWCGLV